MRIADVKGRRKVAMAGIFGSIFLAFIIFINNSAILTYLSLFVFGIFVSLRMLVGYLYALELVPKAKKKTWNLIAFLGDGLVVIFLAGYFYIIQYGESSIVVYSLTSL